jgi:phosphoglycerate dehydrogenase-like enzyme
MRKPGLKIWSNVNYHDEAMQLLREGTKEHQLIHTPEKDNGAASLAKADIAFGQPDVEVLKQSPNLLWVHLDSAGYEKFDNKEMRVTLGARGTMITSSSSVFDDPCAQHLLAMILSLARRIPHAFENQRNDHSWPMKELRAESFLLNGQTALLLGFGAISRRLAELLAPLRMNLIAVRRSPSGIEPIRTVKESDIEKYLPLADHVINTLPANSSTFKFINTARIKSMKAGAIFYNIGRGSTVDQEALLDALQSGYLAGAYLDVTDPEPLPPEHPLWIAPNCFITPHTAGGHFDEQQELVRHVLENLRRFTSGEDLIDRII